MLSADAIAEDPSEGSREGPSIIWATAGPSVVLGTFEHPAEGRQILAAAGLTAQFFGLRWTRFSWAIVDVAAYFGQELYGFRLTTQPGYPIELGDRRQHQLRLALGLGFGASVMDVDYEAVGAVVVPTIGYLYQTGSGFLIGAQVDATLHVTGADDGQFVASFSMPLGRSAD